MSRDGSLRAGPVAVRVGAVVAVVVVACGGCGSGRSASKKVPRGVQGEWLDVAYDVDGEHRTDRIIVDRCEFAAPASVVDGPTVVRVRWRVENRSVQPAQLSWRNKFLVDSKGTSFAPKDGDELPPLQATQTSKPVRVNYEVRPPAVVDMPSGMTWTLMSNDKPVYAVALKCSVLDECSVVGDFFEMPSSPGMGHDDIAARCRANVSVETQRCIVDKLNERRSEAMERFRFLDIQDKCFHQHPMYGGKPEQAAGRREFAAILAGSKSGP